jgi:hypothetical protein
MSRIPLPDLQKPSIAAYYGLVLKATGNTAKAKQCFDLAARSRLLPQERTLIDQAMRGDPR